MPRVAPAAPPQIPDYDLLRLVGQGACGDVWLARGLTGVYRAVKVVWRDRFPELQPYEREFSGLRDFARVSINEPRQLALLHVGRNDVGGFFYYVMELADDAEHGRNFDPDCYTPLTLKRYLERERRLPVRQVVSHGVELARALANLHAHGLVHRDIKPSNLILVEGRPKLADIGLVAAAASARTFVGTEGFVPPEGPGTPAADVYSLGKVLYELAMGRDRNDYPRLPDDLQDRADAEDLMELNEVIVRACDPSPKVRYSDAETLLHDLLLLDAGRSVRRLRLAERGLARARRVVLMLGLVTAVAFGGAFAERRRAEREATGRLSAEAERDQLARLTQYSGGISRVQRALETGDYGRAREVLRELAPVEGRSDDLSGFEWRALWHEAQGDPAEVIRDAGPSVERVDFSPDGRWYAIHDNSKAAALYAAGSTEPVQIIRGVYRLGGFSSDSQWLVGTTASHLFQAWNIATGESMGEPQGSGFNHPVCLMPGPELRLLALTFSDRSDPRLRVWDLAERREIVGRAVLNALSPRWETRVVGVLEEDRSIDLITHQDAGHSSIFMQVPVDFTSQLPMRWPVLSDVGINAVRAPVVQAAIARFQYSHHQLGSARPALAAGLSVDPSELRTLAFSQSHAMVAAGGLSGEISILDAEHGTELQGLLGHAGAVMAIDWSPDARRLLTADSAGHVRLWSSPFASAKNAIEGIRPSERWEGQVLFCASNRRLAVVSGGKTLLLLAVEDLREMAALESARAPLAFREDGSLVALSVDGKLQHWSSHGSLLSDLSFPWPRGITTSAVMDRTGEAIAAISDHRELIIAKWKAAEMTVHRDVGKTNLDRLVMSATGTHVAAVVDGAKVHIWETSRGEEVGEHSFTLLVEGLSLSPDGAYLAVCFINGDVGIVDVAAGDTIRTLRVSSTAVRAAFSPDSARMICAARNGLLHVYRTNDWRETATLDDPRVRNQGHVRVASIAFSPDGKTLAVHRHDGRLRLWRAP